MTELSLTTPSLLFSAISLILLAYTNRFLSYAAVVRNLKEKYESNPEADPTSLAQIQNFVKRLQLIRAMQMLGAGSLFCCTVAMFCIYIEWHLSASIIFGVGMLMLALSLLVCIWEVQISVEALSLHLQTIKSRGSSPASKRKRGDTPSGSEAQGQVDTPPARKESEVANLGFEIGGSESSGRKDGR